MPRFEPFRGLRYDPAIPLDQVIAPPYDVVEPAERAVLAARHPDNAVRLELPEADPGSGLDRYQWAARLWTAWRRDGVLRPDPGPALYPYTMTGTDGRSTTGVLGTLGLGGAEHPDGPDDVLPHEETLPKPRSDRLDLLVATRANLSPIWGLSLAPGLTAALPRSGPADAAATDDDGVRHELWVLDDPEVHATLARLVASAPVVIADGHHRYQTALTFKRQELARTGRVDGPVDGVLALVVELTDEQVQVAAIHRTIGGLAPGTDLVKALARDFEVEPAGPADPERAHQLSAAGALVLFTSQGTWVLTPSAATLAGAGSDLDSSVVAYAGRDLPAHEVEHRHSRRSATDAVVAGEAQAALLLRPVRADQIAAWAAARRRMAPKTTYFWPKPRTGMVFRALDDELS